MIAGSRECGEGVNDGQPLIAQEAARRPALTQAGPFWSRFAPCVLAYSLAFFALVDEKACLLSLPWVDQKLYAIFAYRYLRRYLACCYWLFYLQAFATSRLAQPLTRSSSSTLMRRYSPFCCHWRSI